VNVTVEDQLDPSWMAILTDPVRLSVLRGLCQLEAATTAELCSLCHTSDPTVRRHLEALEALGLVRAKPAEGDGMTPGRPARRFRLDADAAASLCALFDLLSEPLVPTLEPAQRPLRGR
jgi:predicted ArsR family transcriptional regulator